MNNVINKRVLEILELLDENGATTYLVGGIPRDYLLYNRIITEDYDVEVHNMEFNKILKLFDDNLISYKIQGNFGVIKLNEIDLEIAVPRKENKIGYKHQDFEINLDPFMGIDEAIKRRDFTINTIMYNPISQEFIINSSAQEDLNQRQLRYVSSAFSEDPLRIIRAIRFAVVHNLKIEKTTLNLCQSLAKDLEHISSERIKQEFSKILTAKYLNERKEYLKIYFEDYLNLKYPKDITFTDNKIINLYILKEAIDNIDLSLIASKTEIKELVYLNKLLSIDLTNIATIYDILPISDKQIPLTCDFLRFIGKEDDYINKFLKLANEIEILKKKYNGNYFLAKGVAGKEIPKAQKSHILSILT